MTVVRAQIAWAKDTTEPTDRMVITPHFNVEQPLGPDDVAWQDLADDLRDGMQTIQASTGELRVKVYDAQGAAPNYAKAESVVNEGATQASTYPRELCVCLSYYAERNIPRQRGRMYLPLFLVGLPARNLRIDVSGSSTVIVKAQAIVDLFAGLGGIDVDWVVYSPTTNTQRKVTDWWVDNDWDVLRSRGLKADQRYEGTTGG